MACKVLPKSEQNFIRFVKVCLDVLKFPLVDILASEIQPADLYNEIQQHSCSLLNGKNKLDSNQRSICFLQPPAIPDYNKFDVTLLYKLIRNLCPSLEPTKGWGKDPVDTDTQIGDDIERLRSFRNKNFHESSSAISDNDFTIIWKKLNSVFQRIQSHMAFIGYSANYEEKMVNIKQLDLGDETIDKYKIAYLLECTVDRLKQAENIEEPMISIEGPEKVLCGTTAKFNAFMNPENLKRWSLTWKKIVGLTHLPINSSTDKYIGTTDEVLFIQSVCKEDEGGYQAILSRDSNAKRLVLSNVIFLQATGEPPVFDVWSVTTGMEGITIHYDVKKESPYVTDMKWTKDGETIDNRNKKYNGGDLKDSYFTISSPTLEDRGIYSCSVTNAAGITEMDVRFDVPYAEISTEQQIFFGSMTTITSKISSCPCPDGVEWQKSNDGKTFDCIKISQPTYYGSSCNPESPLLLIPKVSLKDRLHYRLLLWNKIGCHYSNTVYIDATGNPPNISISHRTCIQNKSVELNCNVFMYGNLPAIQKAVWTKNGEILDTQGSGGRFSEVSVDDPSLTIFDVNEYDAGSYQLTATNTVGSTKSEYIILDVPDVYFTKPEKKTDGRNCFRVTIKSIPAPDFVQWSMKKKNCDAFEPVDENVEIFEGTSHSLPHPVLVVQPKDELENCCFQIEVRNFIGSYIKVISDETSPEYFNTNNNQQCCLNEVYLGEGTGIKFAILFDELAENFPQNKVRRLQDFIRYSRKVKDDNLFTRTDSARECFDILNDLNIFTPSDVIFMQHLMRNTGCIELYEKCLTYAETQGALCFYEKQPEKGFKNVQFHVRGNLSAYTPSEIKKIKQTVAAIVGCNSEEIYVNGYNHSTSFFVILSMNEIYVRRLLTMHQHDKDKLRRQNIDYFIVDFMTVYIECATETYLQMNFPDWPSKRKSDDELSSLMEDSYYPFLGVMSSVNAANMYNMIHTASISVSVKEVKHIACLTSEIMWVSDGNTIKEIDINGRILKKLDVQCTSFGSHTLTENGDLLFLKENEVFMLTVDGKIHNLSIQASQHFCIHSSNINGDILVGNNNKVTRYSNLGNKVNQIEMDDEGCPLYHEPIFITENKNGDIIVSDNVKKAVVAVDKSGRYLFHYKGHRFHSKFHPGGICTDVFGHIIASNVACDRNIHLLDQTGHFLIYLMTELNHPQAFCMDTKNNLYIGCANKATINVYTYLSDAVFKEPVMSLEEAKEKRVTTESVFKKVGFHVQKYLKHSDDRTIKTAVAAILECSSEEIFIEKYHFFGSVFLSMKEEYVRKLMIIKQHEREKLSALNIDYFIVDYYITVYTDGPKEILPQLFPNLNPILQTAKWRFRELRNMESALKPLMVHKKEKTKSDMSSQTYMQKASYIGEVDLKSLDNIVHISCYAPNRLWVSDPSKIVEIDETGHLLRKFDIGYTRRSGFAVTTIGDLLFLKDGSVHMLTLSGNILNSCIYVSQNACIYSSRLNGNILIGDSNKVRRYSDTKILVQKIKVDDHGIFLFDSLFEITENKNGDIIVSDREKKALVVVDKNGRHRFNYKGRHDESKFSPGGICTDILGNILVCNTNYKDLGIHLVDQAGQFLTCIIEESFYVDSSCVLCVDDQHNLFVGNHKRIASFKYLTDEHLTDHAMKRTEVVVKQETLDV